MTPTRPDSFRRLGRSPRRPVLVTEQNEIHIQLRLVRLGLDAELVRAVLAEPFDVLGQVRRDVGQVLGVDLPSLLQQLADDLGDVQGVVEDHRVGQQGVEFHRLLLLDGVVVGDDAPVAEADPLGEVVERLHLVGGRGDPPTQRGIRQITQLHGADHTPTSRNEV